MLYKTAQNSIPENNTHDWYIYIKPIEVQMSAPVISAKSEKENT
jgi:hypothetical protein